MHGLTNNTQRTLSWVLGGLVIIALEASLFWPELWILFFGTITVAVSILVLRIVYHQLIAVESLGMILMTLIPAFGVLFFIYTPFWQHLYTIIVAGSAVYVCRSLTQKHNRVLYTLGMTVLLINIFFTTAFVLGLHVFLHVSVLSSVVLFGIMVSLFPAYIRVRSSLLNHQTEQLTLPRIAASVKKIPLWTLTHVFRHYKSDLYETWRMPQFSTKHYVDIKRLVVILSIELFLILLMLPTNIFVGASIMTIVFFCLVSLVLLKKLGLLHLSLTKRYVGVSAGMIALVLISAQFT